MFDAQRDVLVKVSKFMKQKMSRPERDWNPNFWIYTKWYSAIIWHAIWGPMYVIFGVLRDEISRE